jgi:hypothetical protein
MNFISYLYVLNITMKGYNKLMLTIKVGSLSCHNCCDTGPPFFRSHPKDNFIWSPLMTPKGMRRNYSYPDLSVWLSANVKCITLDVSHKLSNEFRTVYLFTYCSLYSKIKLSEFWALCAKDLQPAIVASVVIGLNPVRGRTDIVSLGKTHKFPHSTQV